ncbi:UNVERIFIED_CONTAM: hypothetical protein K2H54_042378, partial [Gekko kuhli]
MQPEILQLKGLLVQVSPTGRHKAVLTQHLERGQKQEVLEQVWSSSGRVKSVNLTELDKHGSVYTDGQFGCLAWSSSETRILYVAERKRPKVQPFFFQDRASQEGEKPSDTTKGEQFVYYDNWGETLSDKSVPVLCVLNVETKEISIPGDIPGHISPGQALWSPNDKGIVFVGWWHEPFRLGLKACSNRRSALFLLALPGGSCELLSSDCQAVSSPRLSPDGTHLVYLEGPAFGPHRRCLKLQVLNWQTKLTHTVVDVVRTATDGALPLLCWAMDNRRVLLSTPQRSRKTHQRVAGLCWEFSRTCWWSPVHRPVALRSWEVKADRWVICSSSVAFLAADLAFEALLLRPQGSRQGGKGFPLIVSPHGGPHAIFEACWRPTMACLCQLGFAVLMVNYRGSLGFGQASIDSLISRVGIQDVEDTQLAVELALQSEPLDPDRIALLGGSHGGFICCHLIGRYPKMYKACAVRSPVINMATLLGTSDIPDWRYTSLGLPYYFERIPSAEDLVAMLLHSPIIHAAKVDTPLLLCVGAKDQRVSPYQALEYYRVLQARGIPV